MLSAYAASRCLSRSRGHLLLQRKDFSLNHVQQAVLFTRHFSRSPKRRTDGRPSTSESHESASSPVSPTIVYNGPLARTFRSLKIFSLSSLGLATALTPFMFIIDTSLPFVARCALAATAMGTSGVSTGLVGWCGQPYVATIRVLPELTKDGTVEPTSTGGIQLETLTLTLRPRYTNVYDSTFLTETKRPFAKWELAENVQIKRSAQDEVPSEETVAETIDARGIVLGRWIVHWNEDRTEGACRAEGKVQRYMLCSPFQEPSRSDFSTTDISTSTKN